MWSRVFAWNLAGAALTGGFKHRGSDVHQSGRVSRVVEMKPDHLHNGSQYLFALSKPFNRRYVRKMRWHVLTEDPQTSELETAS
jgi:hypothetical protein